MSEIRVENIIGETGTDAVTFSKGLSTTGIVTATNVSVGSSVTASTFHGSGAALTGINPGITNAQQFRLAANQSGSETTGTVFTNWQAVMTTYEAIGSNWSQSSGIFSCSATGIYLCMWTMVISDTSTGDAFDPNIQISTNSGGSYTTRSRSWGHIQNSSTARDSPSAQFMFDVTNTSTFRLRFRQSQANDIASGTTIAGSTSENLTNIMFIRLGDT